MAKTDIILEKIEYDTIKSVIDNCTCRLDAEKKVMEIFSNKFKNKGG
jgi:hypothetical protein